MRKDEGYLLPDDTNPDLDVCIRAYVPDDPRYIAAFWGSYEYLANWMAWERDTEKRGKDAAARWRTPFERARDEWNCSPGECGIVNIRQSETVPCELEKQVDCDGAWDTFADMRLCVPSMRISNGILQQDTTGTGTWVDAADAPYTPSEDAEAPAPWENPPEGETGNCLSAANVAAYVDFCAHSFAGSMVDGLTFFQTLSVAITILTALMGLIPLTLLTAAITALYQQVVDSWEDVRDFYIIAKLTDLMACRYDADGSMTRQNLDALLADCNAWRDTLTDNDQRAKWWIAIQLMTLWGPVGMTISGRIWGLTSYECTPCRWVIDWIEGDLSGFVVQSAGTIDSGGLVTAYHSGSGTYRADFCSEDIPSGRVTDKVTIEAMVHDAGTYHDLLVAMRCDYSGGLVEWQDLTPDVWETRVFESTPLETSSIHVYLRESISSGGRIRRVKVEGYYS
jgi:hypothetical protein